ncbi:MAG TPA: hypothetical protein VFL71_14240 [Actinomycetes bacterium]|nr:hypothetical protein [Actinomycetes bacterium]
MFNRVRAIEHAMIVPGTTTAEEAFNLLFARVRNIESMLETLQAAPQARTQIDYDLLADKVAERLSARRTEYASPARRCGDRRTTAWSSRSVSKRAE